MKRFEVPKAIELQLHIQEQKELTELASGILFFIPKEHSLAFNERTTFTLA